MSVDECENLANRMSIGEEGEEEAVAKVTSVDQEAADKAPETESDEHLPRVQVELDKLNYANESINSLELELEESKREYLTTMRESEEQLAALEKRLGSCVDKTRPYYEARIELSEAKDKYVKAKIRFETAQELYVAAKRLQMYAEENLESNQGSTDSEENLAKILQMAKIKVSETELSKQSSDIEQIVAFRLYNEKLAQVEQMEKSLKKTIEKSREYFEAKAAMYKELRFLFTKIEGLKSCLKEAKLAYQQSLKNLELISTEIHSQRQQQQQQQLLGKEVGGRTPGPTTSTLISNSSSTLSSSSSSISFQEQSQSQKLDQLNIKIFISRVIFCMFF